jgi:MSHA biogenesis protein MshI
MLLRVRIGGALIIDADQALARALREARQTVRTIEWVLLPGDYALHTLERPPVPDEELREALRWSIKDLLDFPASEALLDCCALPASRLRREVRMVAVAVARKSVLQPVAMRLHEAGLQLKAVRIPEMILKEVPAGVRTVDPPITRAVLYLGADSGLLVIARGSTFYLSRQIDLGEQDLPSDQSSVGLHESHERVALELQRTIDYYDSQYGHGPVREVHLLAGADGTASLARSLQEVLGVVVHVCEKTREESLPLAWASANRLLGVQYGEVGA